MRGDGIWLSAPPVPRGYRSASGVSTPQPLPQVSWLACGTVAATLLVLYVATACRTVFWYDSGEFATAAWVWGIPHPPGYPAYVLLTHWLTYLPLQPALVVNLFSSVTMALAMGLLTCLSQQLGARPLYAAMSVLLVGSSDLIWANATVAEVYGPGLCVTLGILTLLIGAFHSGRIGMVWFACWLAGFGLGLHYFLISLGLGYVWLLVHFAWGRRIQLGDYLVALALFCFGLTVFVLLPLRAAQGALLNFGNPQTWEQFVWVVSGGTYGQFFKPLTWERGLWFGSLLLATLSPPGLGLSVVGAATLGRAVRHTEWVATLLAFVGNVACFLPYWVHDPEVFLIPSILLVVPLCARGAEWLHVQLCEILVGRVTLSYVVPGLLSGAISYRTVSSYAYQDLSTFHAADDYAQNLVEQLPQGAFLANFTTPPEWQYDAVFTYYNLVLHARPDVTKVQIPSRELLVQMLVTGLSVYVYVPTAEVVRPPFTLAQEGDLIRLGLDGSERQDPLLWEWAWTPSFGGTAAVNAGSSVPADRPPLGESDGGSPSLDPLVPGELDAGF